jgi:protein-S-isoprenylcysteine O-methyltransferase Ste14
LLIAITGALLVVLGVLSLGSSFTPLPRPGARASLRQGGIFGLVRHPVYGGVILIGLGWSLADAPLGLVPTALLAVLFDLKARREETWLIERFPEYDAYRARTPRRFVPWLY